VDVRDVARAHVLALSTPPLPNGMHKRLVSGVRPFNWEDAAQIIRERCADERVWKRLPGEQARSKVGIRPVAPFDDSLTGKVLGFGDYMPFEDTVLGTFEALSLWESTFKA